MKSFLSTGQDRYGVAGGAGKRAGWALVAVFTLLVQNSVAFAQDIRLTALGDSLTQGYGLMPGQGLVPQLEAWLRARGHAVSVLNAGVSGDTTTGGLARLDWTLSDQPQAMIVALGGNDLLRGIDPALARANLDAILTRLGAEGIPTLLVGLAAPGNYGPEYQEAFAAIYPDLAALHGVAMVPDLLAPLAERIEAGESAGRWMQGDMIHPNPDGVALIVEALGPEVEALLQQVPR